ncbi:hypothetical protein E5288_WYG007424 [Bos mutus]|uniref:C2H2-type domain-containing protein n=1 Tax=Bos mutus TaxID=72004 RepID=A0A6B0SCP6_9CETA|nr:hypothetical protein [Bos mutus]
MAAEMLLEPNRATNRRRCGSLSQKQEVLGGCWHGAEDKGAPSEKSLSVEGVSQIKTLKADSCPQKGQPFEKCGPVLRDNFHLPEHQEAHLGQKPYTCGNRFYIAANLQQYQGQHIREIPIRTSVDTALIIKSCRTHLSGESFFSEGIRKDDLASMGFFHQPSSCNILCLFEVCNLKFTCKPRKPHHNHNNFFIPFPLDV